MKDTVEAAVRIREYLDRRRHHKSLSNDDIHSLDVGPDEGFFLLASDIEAVLAGMSATVHNSARRKHGVTLYRGDGE